MKNVSMTINSNAIQSLASAAYVPAQPPVPGAMPTLVQEYSVSFSTKFDSEDEAISFAKIMLENIQAFKNSKEAAKSILERAKELR